MYILKYYLHDTMSKIQEHSKHSSEYIGLTKLQIWRLTLQTYTKSDWRHSTAAFQSNLTPTLQTDRT